MGIVEILWNRFKKGEQMKDKMFYFLLGFMSMLVIAMFVVSINPTPKTEIVCGGCGSTQWYSVIANNE